MTEENKEINKIRELVKKNKAAALGLAVVFATSTMLTGCGSKPAKNPNSILVEKNDEKEDEDDNTYVGGGGYGYYYYSGRPIITGNKTFWSKSPASKGYGGIRGGSVGG